MTALRSLEPIGGRRVRDRQQDEATTNGLEAWGNYQAAANWRLSAGATFLDEAAASGADSGDTNLAGAGNDPKRQFMLRSSLDLPGQQEFDVLAQVCIAPAESAVPS
jgi:iron complex outermembrane receptor protein